MRISKTSSAYRTWCANGMWSSTLLTLVKVKSLKFMIIKSYLNKIGASKWFRTIQNDVLLENSYIILSFFRVIKKIPKNLLNLYT